MSRQWFRKARCVIGSGGSGIDVGKLRIVFEVVKSAEAIPNTATIKIFNLNDDNVAYIQLVYQDVVLTAGYADSFSQIFAGNLQYVSHYRDGPDYITEITAADGDMDYRNAYINETLAAGETDDSAVNRIVARMPNTIYDKNLVQTTGAARSRGKVLQGPARDKLSQIARANGANWSIQDGKLQMIRADSKLGEAIVIDSTTGLLEAPERNDKGISAKCLLNPAIAINGAIKLNNQSIRVKQAKQKALKTRKTEGAPVPLNSDGIYKVIKLTHSGDTRGNDWFTTVECLSLASPIATSGTSTTAKAIPVGGFDVNPVNPMMQTPVDYSPKPTPI